MTLKVVTYTVQNRDIRIALEPERHRFQGTGNVIRRPEKNILNGKRGGVSVDLC